MDEFDSLEGEEKKVEYLKNLLAPAAERIGGSIRFLQADEEVQCKGKFKGRSIRIIMDSSTGGLKVEIKIRNTEGNLDLNYDPEATGVGDEPDPEWDSGGEQAFFIAPGYYITGDTDCLKEQKQLLGDIDRDELDKLMILMKRLGIGWVRAGSSMLRCGLFESLFDSDEILAIVETLSGFAAQFEKEGEQVNPRPSVILGGVAVNPELAPGAMLCPYCNTNVSVGRNRKCPNCGAAL